jgi:hypothetical protein
MKIHVWKRIRPILMGLGEFWKEKLDHPGRALSLDYYRSVSKTNFAPT